MTDHTYTFYELFLFKRKPSMSYQTRQEIVVVVRANTSCTEWTPLRGEIVQEHIWVRVGFEPGSSERDPSALP